MSTMMTATEAGQFTVCYQLKGSDRYVGPWPALNVEAMPSNMEVELLTSNIIAYSLLHTFLFQTKICCGG